MTWQERFEVAVGGKNASLGEMYRDSLFEDRAISYRIDNGFDHFKSAQSVGVMKMVRSDRAASGVIFTLDTESGFRDAVFITVTYGPRQGARVSSLDFVRTFVEA